MSQDLAIPILASLDFEETLAFYRRLGFEAAQVAPDCVIARRGRIEIHFWDCKERHIAENTACYIRMDRVEPLYQEFAALDLAPGRMDQVADMPWGMREFHVWDPHGNLLKFGQEIGSEAASMEDRDADPR